MNASTLVPLLLAAATLTAGCFGGDPETLLAGAQSWFYFLSEDLDDIVDRIVGSSYDLVVIDPIVTMKDARNYDIRAAVEEISASPGGRLDHKVVVAYVDIGQAESYRYYWQEGWRVGSPAWIAGDDPDLWEGNFPVAYWDPAWQAIWFEGVGEFPPQIETIVASGFDGVYLDWVEAYSDENVGALASAQRKDAVAQMKAFVATIRAEGRALDPDFLVIAQNAAELTRDADYVASIDALAQEQVWFDGSALGEPEGDCPLPPTEEDIESEEYVASLSPGCRRMHDALPESTLHMSSESYLIELEIAQEHGLPVFTVDYALEPENVAFVHREARAHGFIPFASNRPLDRYVEPTP